MATAVTSTHSGPSRALHFGIDGASRTPTRAPGPDDYDAHHDLHRDRFLLVNLITPFDHVLP
jgi:hypothetical protein